MKQNASVKMVLAIIALVIVGFLYLFLAGCNSGGAGYYAAPQDEISRLKECECINQAFLEGFPEFESLDDYEKTVTLRDHVHWLSEWGQDWFELPYRCEYYLALLDGEITALCAIRSYTFGALLDCQEFDYRLVTLQTEDSHYFSEDEPDGHTVVEVWQFDHWEMHDPLFNIHGEFAGEVLSVDEISTLLDSGEEIQWSTDGFEARVSFDDWPFPYEDYYFTVIYWVSGVFE